MIEYPPSRTLGDLAVPLAFELARTLRKAPRIIAQGLVEALEPIDGVRAAAAAPNGYINVHLDRAPFLTARLAPQEGGPPKDAAASKTIVEHTAINPNKAAHIGHLRNAALGDTLVRLLRFQGAPVEVQNYIDDTGVQVADVVLGFRRLESRDLAGVREVAETTRFDHYCWDLYARVTDWYEGAPERLEARAATLHDIEQGGNEAAKMARFIAEHIVGC
ncbi:MAG TPA: arginine--tRNA ligase, partial [Dehalococcoidia bacterium]|nr:arginine--tRNA ligase [Dehalococcoidia bacterium]